MLQKQNKTELSDKCVTIVNIYSLIKLDIPHCRCMTHYVTILLLHLHVGCSRDYIGQVSLSKPVSHKCLQRGSPNRLTHVGEAFGSNFGRRETILCRFRVYPKSLKANATTVP
jgi:hypothetical protein